MMTPSRPYLIRAIYEWIVDNGYTPYITVDATIAGTVVPKQFVDDNKIVFNIAQIATNQLRLGNDAIEFQARFKGIIHTIYLPIPAILAIYALETKRGIVFTPDDIANYDGAKDKETTPHLTIVK